MVQYAKTLADSSIFLNLDLKLSRHNLKVAKNMCNYVTSTFFVVIVNLSLKNRTILSFHQILILVCNDG